MKQNLPFIKHILEETIFLLKETNGLTYEDFISNELLKRGCARSFEVIGEAVKNLSPAFKVRYKDIQWKRITGMRDKVIHYYFGVNWDIVWATIHEKIPELKERMEIIVHELNSSTDNN